MEQPTSPIEPAPAPEAGPAAWRWWQGIGGLLTAFMGAQFTGLLLLIIGAGAFGGEVDDGRGGTIMLVLLAQDVCFIGFAIAFAGLRGGPPQSWMFGLRRPDWWPAIGTAALAYGVLVAVSLAWSQVVDVDGSDVTDSLGVTANDWAAIGGAFLVGVMAPIAEEFLFRGLIFRALRNELGLQGGALASGALFGLVHLGSAPIGGIPVLVLFGYLLCLVYARTGSLLICMALHSVNNAFAYGGLVDWTWQIPAMLAACLALLWLAFRATELLFGRVPLHRSAF